MLRCHCVVAAVEEGKRRTDWPSVGHVIRSDRRHLLLTQGGRWRTIAHGGVGIRRGVVGGEE